MGSLLLVRHGQASFGADDYDQLSSMGARQCHALGQHLAAAERRPAAVLIGSLRRHRQSLDALTEGYGQALPPAQVWPGLNEYDSEALVRALPDDEVLPPANTPEGFKAHFRRLRRALAEWMDGRIEPMGMPSYDAFRRGATDALTHVCAHHVGQTVLVVSSGGPISTIVSHVLSAPPRSSIDLNMRMRNSSLTETVFNGKGHQLVSFNGVPHLELPERRAWITHA